MDNMKYFKFELKKLVSGKLFIWLALILIIANIVFGIFNTEWNGQADLVDQERFLHNIDDIIYTAKMNYISIENKDSEMAHYQLEIIDRYSKLKEIVLTHTIEGYPALVTSFIPFACAGILEVIIAIMLTHFEWSSNLIITSFQKKRSIICFSKIFLLLLSSFGTTFVFCCANILGIALSGCKFVGGDAYIQSLERFISCPYKLTLLQAAILRFFVAAFVIFFISLIIFAVGNILRNAAFTILVAALLIAIDFILARAYQNNIFSLFYNININQFITDQWLHRFNGMQLFKFCSQIELLLLVVIMGIAICISVSVICFRYAKTVVTVKQKRSQESGSRKLKGNLTGYEIKKIMSAKVLVGIAMLMIVYSYLAFSQLTNINSDYEKIYKYHVDKMASLSFTEQLEYSTQTKIQLSNIVGEAFEIREKFKNGEVSAKEYNDVQQRAGAAELEQEVFGIIDRQLNKVSEINEKGIPAKLIYSSGWKLLINSDINIVLVFALIWMYSLFWCADYENKFDVIVKGCFVGQSYNYRRIELRRMVVVFISSIVLVMLFNGLELLPIHITYPINNLHEYVIGAGIEMKITHLQFADIFIIRTLLSLIGIVVLIVLIRLLSKLLKKTIFVMLVSISIELFMILIEHVSGGKIFSISNYFAFDLLFVSNISVVLQTVCLIGVILIVDKVFAKKDRERVGELRCIIKRKNTGV